MKITAVICEFNPFHRGHEYILSSARQVASPDGCVLAVMSRVFTQRGTPSIYPAEVRARAALSYGADLVLELPYPYSSSGAEDFAASSVKIALGAGADSLVFGSETGDIEELYLMAQRLLSEEYNSLLSSLVLKSPDARYALLREEAYRRLYNENLKTTPNDILAVEYIKAVILSGKDVKLHAEKRIHGFSATRARDAIINGGDLFYQVGEALAKEYLSIRPFDYERFSAICLWALRNNNRISNGLYGMPDGMLERLSDAAESAKCYDEIILNAATKKYTNAAIRRAILSFVLSTKRESVKSDPLFTRLIGANERGRMALAQSEIPIITRASDARLLCEEAKSQLELAKMADELYDICNPNKRSFKPVII